MPTAGEAKSGFWSTNRTSLLLHGTFGNGTDSRPNFTSCFSAFYQPDSVPTSATSFTGQIPGFCALTRVGAARSCEYQLVPGSFLSGGTVEPSTEVGRILPTGWHGRSTCGHNTKIYGRQKKTRDEIKQNRKNNVT